MKTTVALGHTQTQARHTHTHTERERERERAWVMGVCVCVCVSVRLIKTCAFSVDALQGKSLRGNKRADVHAHTPRLRESESE